MPRPPSSHAIAHVSAGAWAGVRVGHSTAVRASRRAAWVFLCALLALPALAGPLEQRIGDRLHVHCAALTDPTARRECLTDLVAFRARHGLRTNPRRQVEDLPVATSEAPPSHRPVAPPSPPSPGTAGFANGSGPGAGGTGVAASREGTHAGAMAPSPGTDAASTPVLGNQGTLPPVQPILPLRIVQRRAIGYDAYVYRLSDGSVWEDVGGEHSRLRPNALVRITESRFTSGHFMVASNERRRVRPLVCQPPASPRVAERCRMLREGALTF